MGWGYVYNIGSIYVMYIHLIQLTVIYVYKFDSKIYGCMDFSIKNHLCIHFRFPYVYNFGSPYILSHYLKYTLILRLNLYFEIQLPIIYIMFGALFET